MASPIHYDNTRTGQPLQGGHDGAARTDLCGRSINMDYERMADERYALMMDERYDRDRRSAMSAHPSCRDPDHPGCSNCDESFDEGEEDAD